MARTVHMKARAHGFTLVEMIIVLVVAAILMAVAAPNLAVFLKNNKRTTVINEMVTAFNLARSEAIKRGTSVRVCASTDLATCTGGSSFASGFIAITGCAGAGTLVRVFDPDISSPTTLRGWDGSGGAVSAVCYQANGFPSVLVSGIHFNYCDDRGVSAARAVVLSPTGQPGVSQDTDGDGIHDYDNGSGTRVDLTCP